MRTPFRILLFASIILVSTLLMGTIPTVSLNENTPTGGSFVRDGDDRIREYKTQNREILEIDHVYPSSGQSATAGQHKQVTLQEAADIGTGATGVPVLGAQTVDGKPELTFTDEDDNDVILTDSGKISLQNGRLPNDTYLIGRNNADDGDINVLKVGTSNTVTFGVVTTLVDASLLSTSAAPTTDAMISNKKYVDDRVAANSHAFGNAVDKSASYGAQQAATDGYVVANGLFDDGETMTGYTDSNADPIAPFCTIGAGSGAGSNHYLSFTMPVKKGKYWKIVVGGSVASILINWVPSGS